MTEHLLVKSALLCKTQKSSSNRKGVHELPSVWKHGAPNRDHQKASREMASFSVFKTGFAIKQMSCQAAKTNTEFSFSDGDAAGAPHLG